LFSVFSLTTAINKVPWQPGLIGGMNLFAPVPQPITVVMIEEQNNTLALVPSKPRGSPADINVMGNRRLIPFLIPHFPIRDTVMADSILGVRAFGTDNQLEAINQIIASRVTWMGRKLDVTQEWLRLGAIKGVIITALDRITAAPLEAISLFDAFRVDAQAQQSWEILPPATGWTEAMAWNTPIRSYITSVQRLIAAELGGIPFTGLVAICGGAFFDAIAGAPETRQTFLNTQQAGVLREQIYGSVVDYAGCRFIEYLGGVGNLVFVPDDEAFIIPRGVPDLFIEAYAPADYIETVNTMALPRYAKQEVMPFDKGVELESQMNVLPICTRPRVLINAKAAVITP